MNRLTAGTTESFATRAEPSVRCHFLEEDVRSEPIEHESSLFGALKAGPVYPIGNTDVKDGLILLFSMSLLVRV